MFLIAVLINIPAWSKTSAEPQYDLVVYGGTPAGVVAAVQAARMNKSVILIEPGKHLGGLASGGLGATDAGHAETIGGLSREFFIEVGKRYRMPVGWIFEPHVAEEVFEQLIKDAKPKKIKVIFGRRLILDKSKGVIKNNETIQTIVMENGDRFSGKIFIDATYEGDLMAMAGVSCHVGREPRDKYNEELAGVLKPGEGKYIQPKQFFPKSVSPYIDPNDPNSDLLPGIQDVPLGTPGAGDKKIQAYNFRICLTKDPDNMIPITEPENYDPMHYELLARLIAAVDNMTFIKRGNKHAFLGIKRMPNNKTDINDGGVFSTDYIGMNWDYPEAGYERRRQIFQQHLDFTKGLLWFIASDPRVPARIRQKMQNYGYPKDEYQDNDHFTHQLYIREARRMIGQYVMTQNDCWYNRRKEDVIGIGSYGVDSHHVQRVVVDGQIVNEGNFLCPHKSYEIPYRSITPKPEECTNLLVPVCVSSSHVAFGSIRMEPVFMILGQSAATAACIAIDDQVSVQEIEYSKLRRRLLTDRQVLSFDDTDK